MEINEAYNAAVSDVTIAFAQGTLNAYDGPAVAFYALDRMAAHLSN